ncbi:MAG: zinc-ribbon domain-containing protein [Chloroflexota bacterium]
MICATCGTANDPGTKFCENCGARLAAACSNCGSPLKDNTRFCGECGTPAAPGPATVGPAAMRTGEWEAGLEELNRVMERNLDPVDWGQAAGSAYSIQVFLGEPDEAIWGRLETFRALPPDDPGHLALLDAESWQLLVAGEFKQAYETYMTLARNSALNAPDSLLMAAHCAIWLHDKVAAREALDLLTANGQHGPVLDLGQRAARAGLLGLDGRTAEALPEYREVLRAFRERNLPLDEAVTAIDVLAVFGNEDPEGRKQAERAREIFESLGGKGLLGMLRGFGGDLTLEAVETDREAERSSVPAA